MRLLNYALPVLATLAVAITYGMPQAAAIDLNSGLLVTTRARLEVCVSALPGSGMSTGDARMLVNDAVTALRNHPRYESSGYANAPASVVAGCPSAPALLDSGQKHEINGGPAQIFTVTSPSDSRTFVFVVAPDDISRMFGNAPYPMSAQESICSGRDCVEVTTAMYISATATSDSAQLRDRLAKGIGLEAAPPQVEPKPTR